MTEVRIELMSAPAATKAAVEVGISEQSAQASLYRVLLRHPSIAKCVNHIAGTLMMEGEVDHRLRELIIMRIGWSLNGVYEWTHHWRIAHEYGVSERDLNAVRDWEAHDHWSPSQRAVLRATDEMIEEGTLSDSTWSECARLFSTDRELIELVSIIGNWKMMSEMIRSLKIPLEDSVAAWPPDGLAPA